MGNRFEISDLYIMILGFLTDFLVCEVIKRLTKRLTEQQKPSIEIANPRGGFSFEVSDEHQLSDIILECIADDTKYLILNEDMKKVLFELVKAKIKNESLVISDTFFSFKYLKQ